MPSINYDNRNFISIHNSGSGEVGAKTVFHYHQKENIVWAEYGGGGIIRGNLIANCDERGNLDMRYQHINKIGELMTGKCLSSPEVLPDGRIRLHEKWQWTCGDHSSGESVIEEIRQ
jgi:hypothetical protein